MRSITQNLFDRLVVQAEEAENLGLVKTAEAMTTQLEQVLVRPTKLPYQYDGLDYRKDLENIFWSALVRSADFHNTSFDAKKASELVDSFVSDFMVEAETQFQVSPIGAYEPSLPGE